MDKEDRTEIATIKNHLPLINKMEQYFHYILNDSELLKINNSISYLMGKSKKLSKKLNLEIDNIESSYTTTLCQMIIKKIENLQQNNTQLQNIIKNYNQEYAASQVALASITSNKSNV